MYSQSNNTSSAKWLFFLAVVILIGAVALGFNIKDAKWLNGEIASATAGQITTETEIGRKKAELDLQLLETQTEIQIAEMKQQAEFAAAQQQREIESAALAEAQKAEFRSGLYNVLNAGFMILFAALGIVVTVAGVNASLGLRTIEINNAKPYQANKISAPVSTIRHRQPSLAAKHARLREKAERKSKIDIDRIDKMLKGTEAIWSAEEKKSRQFFSGNDPQAS